MRFLAAFALGAALAAAVAVGGYLAWVGLEREEITSSFRSSLVTGIQAREELIFAQINVANFCREHIDRARRLLGFIPVRGAAEIGIWWSSQHQYVLRFDAFGEDNLTIRPGGVVRVKAPPIRQNPGVVIPAESITAVILKPSWVVDTRAHTERLIRQLQEISFRTGQPNVRAREIVRLAEQRIEEHIRRQAEGLGVRVSRVEVEFPGLDPGTLPATVFSLNRSNPFETPCLPETEPESAQPSE